MIYKFEDSREHANCALEVGLNNEKDKVDFSLEDCKEFVGNLLLSKEDIYSLIGALHLLHKQMK
jgi:hypothetical protein